MLMNFDPTVRFSVDIWNVPIRKGAQATGKHARYKVAKNGTEDLSTSLTSDRITLRK